MRDFGGFAGLARGEWFLVGGGVESGGWNCLGRVERLGACWLPGVLLVKSPSRCRIALPVQNHPPDAELSSGTTMLLVFRCFVLAGLLSGLFG